MSDNTFEAVLGKLKEKPVTLEVDASGNAIFDSETNTTRVEMTREEAKQYVSTLVSRFVASPSESMSGITHMRAVNSNDKFDIRFEDPDGPNYVAFIIKYTD